MSVRTIACLIFLALAACTPTHADSAKNASSVVKALEARNQNALMLEDLNGNPIAISITRDPDTKLPILAISLIVTPDNTALNDPRASIALMRLVDHGVTGKVSGSSSVTAGGSGFPTNYTGQRQFIYDMALLYLVKRLTEGKPA